MKGFNVLKAVIDHGYRDFYEWDLERALRNSFEDGKASRDYEMAKREHEAMQRGWDLAARHYIRRFYVDLRDLPKEEVLRRIEVEAKEVFESVQNQPKEPE